MKIKIEIRDIIITYPIKINKTYALYTNGDVYTYATNKTQIIRN